MKLVIQPHPLPQWMTGWSFWANRVDNTVNMGEIQINQRRLTIMTDIILCDVLITNHLTFVPRKCIRNSSNKVYFCFGVNFCKQCLMMFAKLLNMIGKSLMICSKREVPRSIRNSKSKIMKSCWDTILNISTQASSILDQTRCSKELVREIDLVSGNHNLANSLNGIL